MGRLRGREYYDACAAGAVDAAKYLERKRIAAAAPASAASVALRKLNAEIDRRRKGYETRREYCRPGASSKINLRLSGELVDAKVDGILRTLRENARAEKIDVVIDSLGGSAFGAIKIFVELQAHPAEVTTLARGLCASAAAVVFAAGNRRRAGARARFLLHTSAIEPKGGERWTEDQLAVHLRVVRRANEEAAACFMRACGWSEGAVDAAMTDRVESTTQMEMLGLVTESTDPSPGGIRSVERTWIDAACEDAERSADRSRRAEAATNARDAEIDARLERLRRQGSIVRI